MTIERTYGKLKVIRQISQTPNYQRLYLCWCDCGNETVAFGHHLKSGNTTSCGDCGSRGKKRKHDRQFSPGLIFYHLVILMKDNGVPHKAGGQQYLCGCDCGNPEPLYVRTSRLVQGFTKSCEKCSEYNSNFCKKVLRASKETIEMAGTVGRLVEIIQSMGDDVRVVYDKDTGKLLWEDYISLFGFAKWGVFPVQLGWDLKHFDYCTT